MKHVVAWFATHPVAANLLMSLLVLGGATALVLLPIKPYPDFDVPAVVVSMAYPGAAPDEVEAGICQRIEDHVSGVSGIERINSIATEGLCSVRLDLFFDADPSLVTEEVQSRVRAIDTFPADAEQLLVRRLTLINTVAEVIVTGPTHERALKELGRRVRDNLLSLPGITQVSLANSRPYEISIEVSEASLKRHSLTFDEVAQALRQRSIDIAGGLIRSEFGAVLLRARGQAFWGEEFENLAVQVRPDGARVLLRDIARIVDGFEDTGQGLWFDGKPAVLLQIEQVGSQDAGDIVRLVREHIATAPSRYEEGVELTLWTDETTQLEDRLGILIDAALQGLLLVLILLMLLLRPHLATWVTIGIPLAFLGAVLLIYLTGLSLDAVSITGFIIALGMLVDDAVVVGESAYAEQRSGAETQAGALLGAQRVLVPVTFGVLTTIAAFLPLMFATGVIGQALSIVAIVVICCLAASLVECLGILPAHLGQRSLPMGEFGVVILALASIGAFVVAPDARIGAALVVVAGTLVLTSHFTGALGWVSVALARQQARLEIWLDTMIDVHFRALVEYALRNRRVPAAFALSVLAMSIATAWGGYLPFATQFNYEGDRILAQLTMPPGADEDATRNLVNGIEEAALSIQTELATMHEQPVVLHILKATGGHPFAGVDRSLTSVSEPSGHYLGEVAVQLTPVEKRPVGTSTVAAMLRERMPIVPEGGRLDLVTENSSAEPDIDILLTSHDPIDLSELTTALRQELSRYPGVHDVSDMLIPGKDEFELSVTPAGEALGVSLLDVGRQLRQAYHGEEVQRIQRGEDDVRLMLRYTEAERRTFDSLRNMRIRLQDGKEVPLSQVTELHLRHSLSVVWRTNGFRSANVTASVDSSVTSSGAVLADLEEGFLSQAIGRYKGAAYQIETLREREEASAAVLPLLVFALFAIYALLCLPLKSYTQPLVVLTVIPFVWVGSVGGHALLKLTGHVEGLSAASIFGMVAASGVAVNAMLVLLHALNERRAEGDGFRRALTTATVSRFRPILITSATTFVGLAPLMFSGSVAAQSLVPVAVSLAFGILSAAVAALVVIPSLWLAVSGLWRFNS